MLRLPLIVQLDMIALLAPTLKPLFLQLHNKAAQFSELLTKATVITHELKNALATSNTLESPEHSPNSLLPDSLSSDSVLRQLWEISLGLIFNYQSSVATADYGGTREFFVMSLAARYADLHNLDSNNVQQVFSALLNEPQLPQSCHVNSADQPTGVISSHRNSGAEKNPQFIEREDSPAFAVAAETANQVLTKSDINRAHEPSRDLANSTAGSLSSVSDHQLFDLCLRLKSGALSWQSLANDIPLLQRLISSYIRLGHSATAENCADFVAAIESQAELSSAPAAFYRTVLQSLIADKLIDLDAIALEVKSGSQSYASASRTKIDAKDEINTIENLSSIKEHALPVLAAAELESNLAGVNAITNAISPLSLEALAEQLAQGTRTPESLHLNRDEFAQLVAIVITNAKNIASDIQADLIDAIHQQALQTDRKTEYYRRVLVTLLRQESLDLLQLCEQVNQQEILLPEPGLARDAQPVRSLINATAATDIQLITQTLLTEAQSWARVQELQLDNKQWEILTSELIRQTQVTGPDASAELIEAIQRQARLAITPAIYYQLIIQSLLKQDPIDLEAFAARSTAANPVELASSDSDNRNDIVRDAQTEKSIFENHIDSHPVNPDQAMDYPLLTGSDNSVHKPVFSLAQLLAAELPLSQEQLLALQQHVNALLHRANPTLIGEWRDLLAAEQHTRVLIHSVPAHLLHQIAMRLHADRYTWLDGLVKLVMEALALLVKDINSAAIKHTKWTFIFHYLLASDEANQTSARALQLSMALCEQLASVAGIDDVHRLINLTERRIALLKPPAQKKPAMRLQDVTTNPATHSDATTPQWEAGLHINNAGQVLAAAFLPRLFSMLNLMQDGKFIDLGAADRAVHLVQFMVTGQSTTPEYDLILNKILCGISTSIPVSAGIEITEQEQTLIEQMLSSMIQHWKVLGSTSITGLRETFFQRQGWLVLEEDCWRLKVKEQTFDLLLDRLPWSISLIKHGWMDKPLRVSWRNHS